jgi:hypothetical protein
MAAPAIAYGYRYPFASELLATPQGRRLRLATCGGAEDYPHFFRGRLVRPRLTADLLRGLVQIVHSRFHVPAAMLARILAEADPVITSGGDRLRFEAFSACCSAYARVDLLPNAVDGEVMGRGTTNVDFNAPLRTALAKIRDHDPVELAVGAGEFELRRGRDEVMERKVALPLRWLKGFVEVQTYQSRMSTSHEVTGAEALRFLRSLPRSAVKGTSWVVPSGRGLRLSQHAGGGGIAVGGVQRLRVLEDLARHARRLQVFAENASRASAWVLHFDDARFHLVLSPEIWRGFSGEGQALRGLAETQWQSVLPRVQAELAWQAKLDAAAIAKKLEVPRANVKAALQALGSRGLCGYDLADGGYFHRVLPFDLAKVESLQPRLKAARYLLDRTGVTILKQSGETVEALVAGSGVEHTVRLRYNDGRCTCPWFAKHRGLRGPCKHVLAVQIAMEVSETRGDAP